MTLPPNEPPPHIDAVETAGTHQAPFAATPEEIFYKKKRSKWLWITTLVIFAIGLIWLILYLLYFQFHIFTDDAYSNGNIVNVNSSINGTVTAFYADDTDLVEEGQLLVQLDQTLYQVAYERSLSELALQAMQVRKFADDVEVGNADVAIRKVNLSRAKYDTANRAELIDVQAISNEDFIHSKDELTIRENELKQSEYKLKTAVALLGNTPLEKHPSIEEKKALVKEAYYNLKHTKIFAATTGFIAKRNVNVGQSVTKTSDLMAIIPADYVWVDANYKETEITNMRVGQPATVWFDLYGSDVKFEGKVLGIASGTGSIFSLIPPQNATGNWIKIVQRLPVRISLDPKLIKEFPIRLGISAEVTVITHNLDLPKMQQIPATAMIMNSKVFDLSFEELEQKMHRIVLENLAGSN